jgi:hypothetical protein
MPKNTCLSEITYQNEADQYETNFFIEKENLMQIMFDQGKTALNPCWVRLPGRSQKIEIASWIDHAAAQEFIDFVTVTAPTYNITLVTTVIQDLC